MGTPSLVHPTYCSLFLSPSSIPNAGYGIFAGRDYRIGEPIGEPGIGIPVIDPYRLYDDDYEVISEFGWNSILVGGSHEAESVFTLLPGSGMLINFHPTLSNVLPTSLIQQNTMDRWMDPGVGASTHYTNFSFVAKTNITAGEELFAFIGDAWFESFGKISSTLHAKKIKDEERTEEGDEEEDGSSLWRNVHENDGRTNSVDRNEGIIPLKSDYQYVDKVIQSLHQFQMKHNVTNAEFLDILRRSKYEIIPQKKTIQSIFPETRKQFDMVVELGAARAQLKRKTLPWLIQNAQCLDNITPQKSTIAGAGLGAFAKRFIPKGTIVSVSPLVQISDKNHLNLDFHNPTFSKEEKGHAIPQIQQPRQLLINYCFGHRHSKQLFCPTTSVALINHSSESSNTRLQWSDSCSRTLTKSMQELLPIDDKGLIDYNTKLSLDFIATKDILAGEEILLDYTEEWALAWKQYVDSWKAPPKNDTYRPASMLNEENRTIILSSELDSRYSYICRLEPYANEGQDSDVEIPEEDYSANPLRLPQNWATDIFMFYSKDQSLWWWPCDVIGIEQNQTWHKAIVYTRPSQDESIPSRVMKRFRGVPKDAIRFVDKPYTSDMHHPTSFRHYIPIPDDIFPLHWRDDYLTLQEFQMQLSDVSINDAVNVEVDRLTDDYRKSIEEASCGAYVAPSNIPNAGLGTYVGVAMPKKGSPLGSIVPVIPITELSDSIPWDVHDYTWSPGYFNVEFEAKGRHASQVLAVNEGCMANFHPGLVNHDFRPPDFDPILDRCKDPGAGASSDYVNFQFLSNRPMGAGDEVFISYGEHWFESRTYLGKVPLQKHYQKADDIVLSIMALRSIKPHILVDLFHSVRDSFTQDNQTQRVLSSLQSFADLKEVLDRRGTAQTSMKRRSLNWLQKHGYCIDNIYSSRSTIEQAGRGAFTRHFIAKGDVIITTPLIHAWNRDIFDIPPSPHRPNNTNTKQLIYNYHLGHPESSVLFLPTNAFISINHRSQNKNTNEAPNGMLRWSQSDRKTLYYLQRHLSDLKQEHYATMVLELVALRDIDANEEVFIDYGPEWELAWNMHIQNFKSPCKRSEGIDEVDFPPFSSSKAVASMNQQKHNIDFHRWSDYHFTVCDSSALDSTNSRISSYSLLLAPANDGNEQSLDPLLAAFNITYNHEGFDLSEQAYLWLPCAILNSTSSKDEFDVAYFTLSQYNDGAYEFTAAERFIKRVENLPSSSVKFINKPYRSDMHSSSAFRHEIMIPNNLMPKLWRDLL